MAEKCSVMVYFDMWHDRQCKKPAIVERDGKWYCKIHDPEYIKEKQRKADEAYKAKCCATCNRRLESYWSYCPFCGAKKGG